MSSAPAALRLVTGTRGVMDPALCGETAGVALGFYEQQGVRLQITSVDGSAGSTATLLRGEADLAHTNAPWYLQAARGSCAALPAVTVYNWTRQVQWCVAVPADSRVRTVADLRGGCVGTSGPTESAYPGYSALFARRGIDVTWAFVGTGATAADALASGAVDAYVTKDYYAAEVATLATTRLLPAPPETAGLMGTGVSARRAVLREDAGRAAVIGFLRGLVLSTVFTIANPGAALELHWQQFPDSRPVPCDDAARERIGRVVAARAAKWSLDPVLLPRWGQHRRAGWEGYAELFGATAASGDVGRFYTDELLDAVNTVDPSPALRAARAI